MVNLRYSLITAFFCLLALDMCNRHRSPSDRLTHWIGTEIIVCGRRVQTGAPVVLWSDPGGYNAYLPRCFFDPTRVLPTTPAEGCDTPLRYSIRACIDPEQVDLADQAADPDEIIRQSIDQIVLHYDAAGTSRYCFKVLHDARGLSSHFLLDTDGTIYQTLDVRERARHAGPANDRSVGIEIANIGAYKTLEELMQAFDRLSALQETLSGEHLPPLRRREIVTGHVQGRPLHQFPFTDAQYESLVRLVRALRTALPHIQLTMPTVHFDTGPAIAVAVLPAEQLDRFSGILGHYHVSATKIDPGPAFDWSRLLDALQRNP